MPLQTACSACSAKIKVKDELIGKSIKCPKCGKVFKVAPERAAEEEKAAVKAGAAADKPAAKKPPPPAWDDGEEDDDAADSPWDKKKAAAGKSNGKKSLKKDTDDDDEDDAPMGKSKAKSKAKAKDDDDEDDDDKKAGDSDFFELLGQTVLPDATKKMIKNELGLRETGVWVGQPDVKIMTVRAIPKALSGLFVMLVLGIIGSVLIATQLKEYAVIVIPALIVVLLVLALVIAVLVVFMERKKAKATAYVITSKRCIVYTGKWFGGPATESFYPDLLQHMRRMASWVFKDGAGDIVFRSVTTITTTHHSRGGTSTSVTTTYYGFLAIRNMDEIEQKIRATLLRDDDDDDQDDDEDDRPKKKKKKKGRDEVHEDDE